jgi:prepilin-type N-terminal cleavage/methylation domain-containing protein
MRHKTSIPYAQGGFTLVEIIVTITLASILATLMVQYMGTAMTASSGPVNMVRDGAKMEALLEKIISDYVIRVNDDPATAPLQLMKDDTSYGSNVTMAYIEFDGSGNEAVPASTPTNTLKTTVQAAGHSITTLLTNSRAKSDDPVSKF